MVRLCATCRHYESRFAYVRFAVDQMIGAVLTVVLGSWTAVGAWRAEAARQRGRSIHCLVTL